MAGAPDDPVHDFWCFSRQNAVQMTVKDGKIVSLAGITPHDRFDWTDYSVGFTLAFRHDLLFDFNRDLLFDCRFSAEKCWILYQGEWRPCETINVAARSAAGRDGRHFQWRSGSWQMLP